MPTEKHSAGAFGAYIVDGSGERHEIKGVNIYIPGAEAAPGSVVDGLLNFNLSLVDFNLSLSAATDGMDDLTRMFRQMEYRRYFRPLVYRLQPPRSRIVKVGGEWLKGKP